MSAGQDQRPEREQPSSGSRARLGPLPRPLALALLVVWGVLVAVAGFGLAAGPSPSSGAREGLVPELDRSSHRTYALIRVDADALAARAAAAEDPSDSSEQSETSSDPRAILAEASFAIEEALGEARRPLAPPKTEITRWLDAHALYLLPIETHTALAERLDDEAMRAEVQGLRARLSSPLFVVSGTQPRRDPLGIHELSERESGRLGHVAELPGSEAPQVSASGDLLAASGDRLLIGLDETRPLSELETALEAALEGLPVEVVVLDPRARAARVAAQLDDDWVQLSVACLAALLLLLSLVLRRVVPVLTLAGCLVSAYAIVVAAAAGLGLGPFSLGGLDVPSVALVLVGLGLGCDAALRLPKLGPGTWAPPLLCGLALAPLILSPYPLWQAWALWWLLAQLVITVVMRLVFPVLLALFRVEPAERPPGFRLAPAPILAAAVCVVVIGAGAYVIPQLDYRSLAQLPIDDELSASYERELVRHFFDPSMVVEARSEPSADADADAEGSSPAARALDAAAPTTMALASLVPTVARRIDSPGSFVLPRDELEARREALVKLELRTRMDVLSGQLEDQGLRAEAFAEFLRGAADVDDLPSAQAALDGPLGPWIRGYLVESEDDDAQVVVLRTFVELRGRAGQLSEPLDAETLDGLPALHGPAIAALVDQRELGSRVGLVLAAGLWLSGLVVWLGSRSFATALATVFVAACTELGLGVGLFWFDLPLGPQWLPIALLTGVAASLAGARACESVRLGRRLDARTILLATGCSIAVGVVMLGGPQPLWREWGLGLALGTSLACGLGLFVTPGLDAMFGGLDRRPRSAKGKGKEAS